MPGDRGPIEAKAATRGQVVEACCERLPVGVHACPACGKVGRGVQRTTVKAMLRPAALAHLEEPEHWFCATPGCPVVYFGRSERFQVDEIGAPVFQKEPPGQRTVCYCLAIGEGDIREELIATGGSTAVKRVSALVKADRCACEVKNPQGTCCLGNLGGAIRSASATVREAVEVDA
jgi:hypothetical protein